MLSTFGIRPVGQAGTAGMVTFLRRQAEIRRARARRNLRKSADGRYDTHIVNREGLVMDGNAARMLVVGPSWVGDMVMAHSLFTDLCRRHPGVEIDVLSPAWSGPVLARMPEVHRHIDMPVGHGRIGLIERVRLGLSLRSQKYGQAIVIPRSFKSALVPFFAGIPRRTGFRGEMRYGLLNDLRNLDRDALPQTVQRYVALGRSPDAALPPVDIPRPRLRVDAANQQHLLQKLSLSVERAVVGFMPGAEYGAAKRWPAAYYAELAGMLRGRGYQVWLFGSARDAAVCREISDAAVEAVDLSGKTGLQDAIDLIALTKLVVTNDSGLMHIAAATGRNIVALYGSSTPAYTPPLTDRADIVYLGLECSPCFERECPLGHYRCLQDITPADVFDRCIRKIQEH